jgi:uncharacterized membrane protein
MESLGRALYSAFESQDAKQAAACFDHIAERIDREVEVHARLAYVGASVITMILVCLCGAALFFLSAHEAVSRLVLAAAAGALGAGVSVLLLAGTMEIPNVVTPLGQAFFGVSRIFLGLACGICITLLMMANLIMGIARDSSAGITAFALLSGFSERYLPELLKNLESSHSRTSKGSS